MGQRRLTIYVTSPFLQGEQRMRSYDCNVLGGEATGISNWRASVDMLSQLGLKSHSAVE